MVIKAVWYWHTDRHMDQWNRIGSPEINPYIYGQMIFDETFWWGKGQSFQPVLLGNWISTSKRMKLDPHLTPYTKVNSKWIKDLNVRAKAVGLLEENRGKKLHDIGFGSDLLI